MPTTTIEHVKGRRISEVLAEKIHPDPSKIYDVTITLKEIYPHKERKNLLKLLENMECDEDSEDWINTIKENRTSSKLKVPLR